RRDLLKDLSTAGVFTLDFRWTLTPDATERDAWLLLPALALFFAALASSVDVWRYLLWWVVALAMFTLVLGFVQIGVPQDSFLNPFPQYAPALTGVFANKNHQADALAIGLVLSLALAFDARRRVLHERRGQTALLSGAILAVLFVLVLPLVKSRAGVIVGLVVSGMVMLHSGPLSPSHWRSRHLGRVLGVLSVAALLVGITAALAWMQADADVDGSRWAMFVATWRLGFDNAPFGSGFGSFVPMFEQATHGALMRSGYINNAHNDYVQWWFEGGYLAVGVLLAAQTVLLRALLGLLRLPEDSRLRSKGLAAAGGVLVLLLHSIVDYPLRTPALMSVAGLLAGIVVAAAAKARQRDAAGS
ncbi:MAG TPA: O-antigen ligase family protein, partial [Rhodanobacteraceae bacterium]|nr:O-antigen ligase family protein [Rhodanobacteraceae bacterium]